MGSPQSLLNLLCGVLAALLLAAGGAAAVRADDLPERVEFNAHIRPIFSQHCVACHGGVKQAGALSFIFEKKAIAEGDSGLPAIAPGDPDGSFLIDRVSSEDADYRMPPADHGPALSAREIALLRKWIDQGAAWQPPWAFVPPHASPAPAVKDNQWPRTAIDPFILARLEGAGLHPSPEAPRAEWLRRASFAVTGLPPPPDELVTFEADRAAGAYERAADRLLASLHYGERWASVWLDLARYADTVGYEKDPHRDAWPYRDWLIRALNADMPYDEFTVKQLAGDLLPEATIDDRLATAFHRNTQTNTEGGTDDEEFRISAVLDRVNTTWQAWMATTFGCTQCHAHPYDPIEHEEYYRFAAMFNTSRDVDVDEDTPLLAVPLDVRDWAPAGALDRRIDELRRQVHAAAMEIDGDRSQWRNLAVDDAASTGQTQLRIARDESEEAVEVIAEGTITSGSKFTLEGPLPGGLEPLTAIRIEALPKDEAAALRTPELGFVLSHLKAQLVAPGAEPEEIELAAAFCDEPAPQYDPEASLRDDKEGWSDYTRINYRRFCVFVLKTPLAAPEGSRLRLELRQDRYATGDFALVMRRGRYYVSDSAEWPRLLASESYQSARRELGEAIAARGAIASVSVPVMEELAPHVARKTYVFERGNWLNKGAEAEGGTPGALPPLEAEGPANRLAAARWIASRENPLTARVLVNRAWEQAFGRGLVETVEDFGSSGSPPSHPQLLDDLAVRFMDEHQWSLKRLVRELVLSAAFRQSAKTTPELLERDPQNRLLARGPRQRLRAEMVRDQALVLSGRFSEKMYGPPVMPPQPEGIWRSAYSDAKWQTAEGEDRYRRAIYTYWKRTSPYPSLMAFDAPSRDLCTARRIATNTPLQALVTLNDEALNELAAAFAERMEAGGKETRARIAWGYRTATGREATAEVIDELVKLHGDAAAEYGSEAPEGAAAAGGAAADLSETPQQQPVAAEEQAAARERFALSVVANAILNLDEVLTQ
ncbi:MAG: PSD1 domain-containing protein [Pirellulales bacterium]|nr:PSD1 domain-containing protein [Pirellulales bacterium]